MLLCGRGVVFEDTLFTEILQSIEVKAKRSGKSAREFELVLGDERFEYQNDPADLASRLERWFRYWFGEFLPQATHVLGWRSPGLPGTFRLHKTVACPECRRTMLPRIGDLGVLVEEPEMIERGLQVSKN